MLEGEIVENNRSNPEIILNTGLKNISIFRSEVRKVFFDRASRTEFQQRFGAIKGKNAAAHFELYKWCKDHRLYRFAEGELKATLAADPNHAQARKALGYVYHEGKWLSASEARKLPVSMASFETGDEFFIGGTRGAALQKRPQTRVKQAAFNKRVVSMAKVLGQSSAADERKKQEAITTFLRNPGQAGGILLGCLDFRRFPDSEIRQGALKGLKLVKPSGPRVSDRLSWTAIMDPVEEVRLGAVQLIKDRKDDKAVAGMIRRLVGAFDNKTGNVRNAPLRDAAVKSIRALNDPRVAEALLYYVVLEMRPTMTELASFRTRQIDSFTIQQGGNVIIPILLSFPVQFPELKITRVRTTVSAPASALRAVTGQNFGNDVNRWLKWIRKK